MANFARIVDNVAVDVSPDPANHFHPELAAQFVAVPDEVGPQWRLVAGQWQAPAPEPAAPASLPLLTPMQFYLAFKPAERIAIKGSADPIVKEFWATYELAVQVGAPIDPNLASVVGGVQYLATPAPNGPGILAAADRVAQILAGAPQ